MAKKSQVERAIEQLDSEIAVLQLAKAKLMQQQTKVTARKPRAVRDVAVAG